jgi:hypothetical protein
LLKQPAGLIISGTEHPRRFPPSEGLLMEDLSFISIRFLQDTTWDLVVELDETSGEPAYEPTTFFKDEVLEGVTLLEHEDGMISFQFDDGSCIYGLPLSHVEVIS